MTSQATTSDGISIALTGSGGAGVLTAGNMLLDAAGRAGWYGFLTRSVGPQIRGGESAALLRLSRTPVGAPDDRYHVLLAIDWHNAERFAAELPLGAGSLVIGDPEAGEPPAFVADSGARLVEVPIQALAKSVEGGRPNMVALGVVGGLIGLAEAAIRESLEKALARKGADAVSASLAAFRAGLDAAGALDFARPAPPDGPPPPGDRWAISGNQAAGLGAIRGGVRFVAGYPITPATDLLEWMAPGLARVGGVLVQAEDELSSINMVIGASYGGVPALTATSGPGLALMLEAIGLAVAAEVPVVVVDVMRGGPSTGLPTKSEQSDLNIAVYGLHGDAPHLVLAPVSVADCLFTTQWAVHLAESLQVPAIVLSDQLIGQAKAIVDRPADITFMAQRHVVAGPVEAYQRYAITANGVSAMALPGTPGGQYTADGLTHNPKGTPSSQADDHLAQLDKRRDKLAAFDYGSHWADIEGEGRLAIVTWGSTTAPVREALRRARAEGVEARLVALRLIAPARPAEMAAALEGVERVLVVEQTHSGQFLEYLRAKYDLPGEVRGFHRPGPLPIRPGEILEQILDWS